MSSSDSPRRFLGWFSGVVLAVVASLLGLTALVDPRGLVAQLLPDAPRLCERGIIGGDRAAKRILPQVRRATDAFLGNSRVAWGFAAEDVRTLIPGSAINLGVEAATLPEMSEQLDGLVRSSSVRRVWIALDFEMFNHSVERREPASDLPPTLHVIRHGVADFSAIRQSLRTLARGECRRARIDLDGFRQARRADRLEPVAYSRTAFARTIPWMTTAFRASRGLDAAERERRYDRNLALVRAMALKARKRGIALVIFVPPSHPVFFQALRRAGGEADYRRWQLDLTRSFGRTPGITFRDFTGASRELVGTGRCAAEGAEGCAFYDPVHFRLFVGAMILRSVVAPSDE
jgi:hypothetical protein